MDWKRFNEALINEFRANHGEVTGPFAGVPLLLLTTTGVRSGKLRVNPLVYGLDGDDVFVIASNKGALAHPDWYRNLRANSNVTVEMPGETFEATAVEADEERRARLYAQKEARWSAFTDYRTAASSSRTIPVIVLQRGSARPSVLSLRSRQGSARALRNRSPSRFVAPSTGSHPRHDSFLQCHVEMLCASVPLEPSASRRASSFVVLIPSCKLAEEHRSIVTTRPCTSTKKHL